MLELIERVIKNKQEEANNNAFGVYYSTACCLSGKKFSPIFNISGESNNKKYKKATDKDKKKYKELMQENW